MKKSFSEGNEFYYLGKAKPVDYEEILIKEKQRGINIKFELLKPIDENMYEYIVN